MNITAVSRSTVRHVVGRADELWQTLESVLRGSAQLYSRVSAVNSRLPRARLSAGDLEERVARTEDFSLPLSPVGTGCV